MAHDAPSSSICTKGPTRVFVLLTWGVVAHGVQHSLTVSRAECAEADHSALVGVIAAVALAALFIPRIHVWNGAVHLPPFNLKAWLIPSG